MINHEIIIELESIVGDKFISDDPEITFLYHYDFGDKHIFALRILRINTISKIDSTVGIFLIIVGIIVITVGYALLEVFSASISMFLFISSMVPGAELSTFGYSMNLPFWFNIPFYILMMAGIIMVVYGVKRLVDDYLKILVFKKHLGGNI